MVEDQIEIDAATDEEPVDVVTPFKYAITSYGADYPVDGLVKRINEGAIVVPSFQRSYVWSLTQASRFIESLLLGLPVPGIFLSKDDPTQKLLVIDGQQRLKTLQFFYEGIFGPSGKRFVLEGVQSPFEGATYKSLQEEDRRRLDDSILHATVIKQDEPSEDESSIYYIFERLNTGGVLLQPQEIRSAIYFGPFNDLLKELNSNPAWRSIYGGESTRMRDQELILRFLALYFQSNSYRRPLKAFLNSYMGSNRYLKLQGKDQLVLAFSPTIELIGDAVGAKAFKPKRSLNAAVFDAVMVGIARRLQGGPVRNPRSVGERYAALLADDAFAAATERSTTDEESVKRRLSVATEAFAGAE